MENLNVKIDPKRFEEILKDSLPDGGDLEIVVKPNATNQGNAAVMITFTAQLPDGTLKRAQTVTTLRLFNAMADITQNMPRIAVLSGAT